VANDRKLVRLKKASRSSGGTLPHECGVPRRGVSERRVYAAAPGRRKKRKGQKAHCKEGSFILWLRIAMAAILELCEDLFICHGARVSSRSNVRRARALKNVEHAS
jgi:hypothetical protein